MTDPFFIATANYSATASAGSPAEAVARSATNESTDTRVAGEAGDPSRVVASEAGDDSEAGEGSGGVA